MQFKSLQAVILAAMMVLTTAMAGQAADNCARLRQACNAAGFDQGSKGAGSVKLCVKELVNNKSVEARSLKPLPDVAHRIIAACRIERAEAEIARFGAQTPAAKATPTLPEQMAAPGSRPNIIFILADDFSWNLMPANGGDVAKSMPNLAALQADGVTFDNFFVTDSLCCPSRSSILTGLMPHNTGVYTNAPPSGGYETFMARGDQKKTMALAFSAKGYLTAMLGKYLNGYHPQKHGAGPGWGDWSVAGNGYREYATVLNTDGKLWLAKDYLTDVMAERAAGLIDSAKGRPVLLYIAPFAPHAPYTPPDRYRNLYPDLTYPRGPAYRARPDAAAPAWLKAIPALRPRADGTISEVFRNRVRSDKAIDDMIGALRSKLEADGLAGNTYFVFASDNGYHMGEYSLFAGKMTPFDIDIRVPLVIAGPGIPRGEHISQIAMNIDLFPTFADLAGLPRPANVDGTSLVPLLGGATVPGWRNMAVVEHEKTTDATASIDRADFGRGNPDSYVALRLPSGLYVEYPTTGEHSYYDLAKDPWALHNIYDSLPATRRQALSAAVAANHSCAGEGACWRAQQLAP